MEEAYLDNEDVNGVLGVVRGGIGSLEDASLIGSSGRHGDSRLEPLYGLGSETQSLNEGKQASEEGQRARGSSNYEMNLMRGRKRKSGAE